jgi:hypothetical protein
MLRQQWTKLRPVNECFAWYQQLSGNPLSQCGVLILHEKTCNYRHFHCGCDGICLLLRRFFNATFPDGRTQPRRAGPKTSQSAGVMG